MSIWIKVANKNPASKYGTYLAFKITLSNIANPTAGSNPPATWNPLTNQSGIAPTKFLNGSWAAYTAKNVSTPVIIQLITIP